MPDVDQNRQFSGIHLKYLIKLKPFAIGADDVKIFTTFLPKWEEHGFRLYNLVTVALKRFKNCVNIIHIKSDMVYMAIFPGFNVVQ